MYDRDFEDRMIQFLQERCDVVDSWKDGSTDPRDHLRFPHERMLRGVRSQRKDPEEGSVHGSPGVGSGLLDADMQVVGPRGGGEMNSTEFETHVDAIAAVLLRFVSPGTSETWSDCLGSRPAVAEQLRTQARDVLASVTGLTKSGLKSNSRLDLSLKNALLDTGSAESRR